MRYLIVDLNVTLDGHKLGFLQNIVDYITDYQTTDSFIFFTNANIPLIISNKTNNISHVALSDNQVTNIKKQKHYYQKSGLEWRFIHKKATELNIDKLILLELDPYQIALGKTKVNYEISGIWFRPYMRMQPENTDLRGQIVHKINILKKKIILKVALRNPNLKKVYILNEENLFKLDKKRFFTLPDPCFEYDLLDNFNLRKHYNIADDKIILLQFGAIDERKNTENLMQAINLLSPELTSKFCLLIIGVFKPNYANTLEEIYASNPNYQLVIDNQFVSNEHMQSTFSQSDLIIRMNLNFFASSGIVGIAAMHNKACLVSDYGVMADLVKKYELGFVASPTDTENISKILKEIIENPDRRIVNGVPYLESHSRDIFVKTLFS